MSEMQVVEGKGEVAAAGERSGRVAGREGGGEGAGDGGGVGECGGSGGGERGAAGFEGVFAVAEESVGEVS